jgi:hypothetical protein
MSTVASTVAWKIYRSGFPFDILIVKSCHGALLNSGLGCCISVMVLEAVAAVTAREATNEGIKRL